MIEVILRIRDGEDIVELTGSFPEDSTVLDALETLRARAEAAKPRSGASGEGSGSGAEAAPAPRVPHYRHSCHHGS